MLRRPLKAAEKEVAEKAAKGAAGKLRRAVREAAERERKLHER